tara:strand:- start:191 stop:730 length:540 start_codon:yes stop_codon:yes gene_type:complete
MANARKIIVTSNWSVLGSSSNNEGRAAVALEELTLPSTQYTKFKSTERYGSRYSHSIHASQPARGGWTSTSHDLSSWDDTDHNWNLFGKTFDTITTISTSGVQLSEATDDIGFVSIKNTGSVNVKISLEGDNASKYFIVIPAGALIGFPVNNSAIEANEVYAKTASGSTTIEYIVAKIA